jgi:AI-2 transport protein TqsA
MMGSSPSPPLRLLQAAAYVVVVAWGIKAASHLLSVVLIALLLTYVILPFPKWLMHRFRLRKSLAILLTVAFVAAIYLVISVALIEAVIQLRERLPIYEEHLRGLYERIAGFLSAHGNQSTHFSVKSLYSFDRILELTRLILPSVIGLLSDRFLISLLALIFLAEMVDPESAKTGSLARSLVYYGGDVQRFISISAKTGAINALANLVLLVALGVDFAFVWCFLYFFLHFIPNLGFLVSIIPPSLMALLMLGWKRALLVTGGLILTEMLGDYVVKPMLMIKGLHISLLEIMLSLMLWGYLLGPAGGILAVPLTLALRRFIERPLAEGEPGLTQVPG